MAWHSHIIRNEPIAASLREAKDQYLAADAPIILTLIWVVTAVFAVEVALSVLFGTRSIRVLATGSFKLHPELAWLVAPFLHAGIGHLIVNIGGLAVVGIPLEQYFSKRRFGIFIVVTAYLSTFTGGLTQAVFTTDQVAMYGISGVVYAMGGFGLVHFGSSNDSLPSFEWVALMFSLGAGVIVAFDPFTGPYFHPDWINGGHTSGFLIGVIAGMAR